MAVPNVGDHVLVYDNTKKFGQVDGVVIDVQRPIFTVQESGSDGEDGLYTFDAADPSITITNYSS